MRIFSADGVEEIGLSLLDCRMDQAIEFLPKLGILENDFAKNFTIDASIAGDNSRTERLRDAFIDGIAGREQAPREQVRLNDAATQLGKHPANSTLPCSNSTRKTDFQHAIPRRILAALIVFFINTAMVMGPTPPGTGVNMLATSITERSSTSPTQM
jgi:hypothetical protein